jgi:hypothetical protein
MSDRPCFRFGAYRSSLQSGFLGRAAANAASVRPSPIGGHRIDGLPPRAGFAQRYGTAGVGSNRKQSTGAAARQMLLPHDE